ncbi:MAG: metal-dependent transcriptional regulator [Thermoplasmata archaeon]
MSIKKKNSLEMDITEREYDCLNVIEKLNIGDWPAKVLDISKNMKVKPPTVIAYIKKLTMKGYVLKGPGGYKITKKGETLIKKVTRAHRIMETMFVKEGIALSMACTQAKKFQLLAGDDFVDCICKTLKHPTQCPHGLPIPSGGDD